MASLAETNSSEAMEYRRSHGGEHHVSIVKEMYERACPTSKHITNCWERTRPRSDEVKTIVPLDMFYILSSVHRGGASICT